jgi:hypothetical protein
MLLTKIPDSRHGIIYKKFITKILDENRKVKKSSDMHVHHIFPRSLCTDEDFDSPLNLVSLTLREHFFAHLLLTKVFGDAESEYKMKCAFFRFSGKVEYIRLFKSAFKLPKTYFINNGVKNTLAFSSEISSGFTKGKIRSEHSNGVNLNVGPKGKVKVHNKRTNEEFFVKSIECLADSPDYVLGRAPNVRDKIANNQVSKEGWRMVYREGKLIYIPPDQLLCTDITNMSDEQKLKIGKSNSRVSRAKQLKWFRSPDNTKELNVPTALESPPEGWVPGRLPASKETREKLSAAIKGKTRGKYNKNRN